MPEDRPSPEEIDNDRLFDQWLVRYERDQQKKTAKRKKMQREAEKG